MKYFTPQLYVEFNSDDPDAANKADEEWERALDAYRRQLAAIRNQLPEKLREFAESVNLHDARYLGFVKAAVPKSSSEVIIVGVQRDDELILLIYVTSEEPTLSSPVKSGAFSHGEAFWLYDEIDFADEGRFIHEVLLSNGRVLSMTFVAFDMLSVNTSKLPSLTMAGFSVAAT